VPLIVLNGVDYGYRNSITSMIQLRFTSPDQLLV